MKKDLIAPCGINCGVCVAYLREKNRCPGCNCGGTDRKTWQNCVIRLCKERQGKYCFECSKFPCDRLNLLDKRYREKYGISEIKNLETVRDYGVEKFLSTEEKRWVNKDGVLCMHNKKRFKYSSVG